MHAQSVLQFAEVADTHHFQAEHNLLCSPFNLPSLLLFWLPAGRRKKRPPAFFSAVATAYLDGVCTHPAGDWSSLSLPTTSSAIHLTTRGGGPCCNFRALSTPPLSTLSGFTPAAPGFTTLPSGRDEIPHLLYLLTLVPFMMAVSMLSLVLHIPFCAVYFASVVSQSPACPHYAPQSSIFPTMSIHHCFVSIDKSSSMVDTSLLLPRPPQGHDRLLEQLSSAALFNCQQGSTSRHRLRSMRTDAFVPVKR